jgi:hypothetical protein
MLPLSSAMKGIGVDEGSVFDIISPLSVPEIGPPLKSTSVGVGKRRVSVDRKINSNNGSRDSSKESEVKFCPLND